MSKENRLRKLGISSDLCGFYYILDACDYIEKNDLKNPFKILITVELYPYIARKRETTPVRVESAIRHAIEKSYNSGKLKEYYEKSPNNKTFLIDFTRNYI